MLIVGLCLVVSLLSTCCAASVTPYECPSCLKIRVGRAQYVAGPAGAPYDNPFFTLKTATAFYGYSANGDTSIIAQGNINNYTSPAHYLTALKTGDDRAFDSCGAWLNSAMFGDDRVVHGWYHAETLCNYTSGVTYKSIAYAESRDGGLTFTKPDYPHNQVLTGTTRTSDRTVGNGDHTVVDGLDGYYYMFFIKWGLDYSYCVARASKSSGGRPGAWMKYYEGKWEQPGLGGDCSNVGGLLSGSAYRHTSGNFISVGSGLGVTLSFGRDSVTWKRLSEPLLSLDPSEWNRSASSTQLIAYPALVPMEGGDAAISEYFWLYYTYLLPGGRFSDRYLIRRAVTMWTQGTTDGLPQAGVELTKYVNGSTSWSTTTVALGGFRYTKPLGFLATFQYANMRPLYDCYIPSWGSHMPTLYRSDCAEGTGITYNGHMGFVYKNQPTQPATLPLYRCFNNQTLKHSLSNNVQCDGDGYLEFIMGYTIAF